MNELKNFLCKNNLTMTLNIIQYPPCNGTIWQCTIKDLFYENCGSQWQIYGQGKTISIACKECWKIIKNKPISKRCKSHFFKNIF